VKKRRGPLFSAAPCICRYITDSVFSNNETRNTVKQFLMNSFLSLS